MSNFAHLNNTNAAPAVVYESVAGMPVGVTGLMLHAALYTSFYCVFLGRTIMTGDPLLKNPGLCFRIFTGLASLLGLAATVIHAPALSRPYRFPSLAAHILHCLSFIAMLVFMIPFWTQSKNKKRGPDRYFRFFVWYSILAMPQLGLLLWLSTGFCSDKTLPIVWCAAGAVWFLFSFPFTILIKNGRPIGVPKAAGDKKDKPTDPAECEKDEHKNEKAADLPFSEQDYELSTCLTAFIAAGLLTPIMGDVVLAALSGEVGSAPEQMLSLAGAEYVFWAVAVSAGCLAVMGWDESHAKVRETAKYANSDY